MGLDATSVPKRSPVHTAPHCSTLACPKKQGPRAPPLQHTLCQHLSSWQICSQTLLRVTAQSSWSWYSKLPPLWLSAGEKKRKNSLVTETITITAICFLIAQSDFSSVWSVAHFVGILCFNRFFLAVSPFGNSYPISSYFVIHTVDLCLCSPLRL